MDEEAVFAREPAGLLAKQIAIIVPIDRANTFGDKTIAVEVEDERIVRWPPCQVFRKSARCIGKFANIPEQSSEERYLFITPEDEEFDPQIAFFPIFNHLRDFEDFLLGHVGL